MIKTPEQILAEKKEVEAKVAAEKKKAEPTVEQKEITQLKAQLNQLALTAKQEQESRDQEALALQELQQQEAADKLTEEANLKKLLGEVESDKVEDLTNRQVLDIIADAVENTQAARNKQVGIDIANATKSTDEKITGLQKAVMQLVAVQGVNDAKSRHPDFEEYRNAASKIMGEVPGISVDRAILLAKAEAAGHSAPAKKVESERPGNAATKPGEEGLEEVISHRREADSQAENYTEGTGIQGFRDILSAGVDKAITRTE